MSDAAAGAAVRTATPSPRRALQGRMRNSPQAAGRPPAPSRQAGNNLQQMWKRETGFLSVFHLEAGGLYS
ncbi:unnamed protein product [Rangifer tarandus platyrhynchus]|uniref:Uncharacterized protein n=1 Tax=Rangifer tarandus platyrhynchus TaxID=3082113 RepID=A0AC59YEB1_RANTA